MVTKYERTFKEVTKILEKLPENWVNSAPELTYSMQKWVLNDKSFTLLQHVFKCTTSLGLFNQQCLCQGKKENIFGHATAQNKDSPSQRCP